MRCETCEHYDGDRCCNRDSDHWREQMKPQERCLDYEPKGGRDD